MVGIIPEEKLAELKATSARKLHILSSGDGEHEIVVRGPNRIDWKKFRAAQRDEERQITARQQLVLDCTVYPDAKDVAALFDELPFLGDVWGERIAELGGLEGQAQKKAL